MTGNKKDELAIVVQESGLDQADKVSELLTHFTGYFDEAKVLAEDAKSILVTDRKQAKMMSNARKTRLAIRRIRINADKTRKELKASAVREGNAIQGVYNVIKALIVPVEEHLEQQENYIKIVEAEKQEKIHTQRVEALSKYVEDVAVYNLKDMTDEAFDKLLADSKKTFEDQKKAEQKEEEDRVAKAEADIAEQLRVQKENKKLREQAEAREKKLEIERKKREAVELKAKEEQEKRDEKERVAKAKVELEAHRKEEEKRKALLAPDKDKLNNLAVEIDKFKFPSVESKEAGQVIDKVQAVLYKVTQFLRDKAKTL